MFLIIDQQLIVFTSDYVVSCYPGFRANYYRLFAGIASDTIAAAQEVTNAFVVLNTITSATATLATADENTALLLPIQDFPARR